MWEVRWHFYSKLQGVRVTSSLTFDDVKEAQRFMDWVEIIHKTVATMKRVCKHESLSLSYTGEDKTVWYECNTCAKGFWITEGKVIANV